MKILKGFKFFIILLIYTLSLISCKTIGQTLRSDRETLPGKNYFDPSFKCEKDLLEKEKNLVYLQLRDSVRKQFPVVQEKPFLVLAGESTMALFPIEDFKEYFQDYKIVNRAIGGETTVLLLSVLESDIISLQPDVILISIGGNDLIGGRCINNIINNINLILFNIRFKLPETYVIFASVPPVLSPKVNSISPYLNQKIQSLLKNYPKSIFLDLWEILSEQERPILNKEYFRKIENSLIEKYDQLHFNTKGYEEIVKQLKPILDQIYQEKYKKQNK